ncbi:MAG TPA: helix-hairpin-helix domain-containing protein [Sedimentisphaerales bacterium]|nr:helix-hairpin-helix domain-containing protein [Sedimentisphaerales bacterium]
MKQPSLKDLEQIPGVGKSIARDLRDIGISSVDELKGKEAEKLYKKMCNFKASPVDRCMLYALRCAVYYASNTEHDANLLKWWNWKDKR